MGARVAGGAEIGEGVGDVVGAFNGERDGAYEGTEEIAFPTQVYCLYITFSEYPGGAIRHWRHCLRAVELQPPVLNGNDALR